MKEAKPLSKRQEVERYLASVPQASIADIYKNMSFGYYHNEHKHLGEVLAKMVKAGTVIRISKGLYRHVKPDEYARNESIKKSQTELF